MSIITNSCVLKKDKNMSSKKKLIQHLSTELIKIHSLFDSCCTISKDTLFFRHVYSQISSSF